MTRLPTGTLYLRGNIWWLKYKFLGRQNAQTLATDNRITAENAKARIMAKVHDEILRGEHKWQGLDAPRKVEKTVRAIMLEDVWRMFETSADRPDCTDDTLRQYRCQFERWFTWMQKNYPDLKNMASVSRPICREFVEHLRYKGNIKASTFNKYLNLLSLVFRVIGQQDESLVDYWSKFQKRRLETDSHRIFSLAEILKIISNAKGEMLTICLLGAYTGLRLKDCCLMKWNMVSFENALILATPSKTKRKNRKTIRLHIHHVLMEHLQTLARDSEYLCPTLAEQYMIKASKVTDRLQAFFESCGLRLYAVGTGPGTGRRAVVEVGFHSFRHSLVTAMQESGVPRGVVMEVVNHGNPIMQSVYTHCGEDALRDAIEKLPSYKMNEPRQETVPA